ncbi:YceI family protein [Gordonia westfalica]|uniref:YceI family protein n=1 Tax=Gordonia westfalica TaxID=158898 RepID=A0ABU2GW59_9ACTN|nr:YceI family protein [Gordonia westfalica]MDS1115697.1 YceI family protein [Gordonia westfalica]
MAESVWEFSESDGSVVVHTGVTGPAARTGHRLTISMRAWTATVTLHDSVPTRIAATISVDSMHVETGEGGLTPMTGAEKSLARMNALKSMRADKYPDITYESDTFTPTSNGFRAAGTLTIHGRTHPQTLDFQVVENSAGRQITTEATVTQSDFGIKPYSLMMGALKVADDVRVVVDVTHGR